MDLPEFGDARIAAFYGIAFVAFVIVPILGGKPERYSVVVMLTSLVVQTVLHLIVDRAPFHEVDWARVIVDSWIFVGLVCIALNANRTWPIFASAMALLSLASHFARQSTDMLGFSYAQFNFVPTATILLLMLFGMVGHRWRLRRRGEDPDWVPFGDYSKFRQIADKAEL